MANRKFLPREPAAIRIPGGSARPSQHVSLRAFPLIRARQQVSARLQTGTCAFSPADTAPWSAAQVPILAQIASERFSGAQALLRGQAVKALANADSVNGVDRLTSLAASPVESAALRSAAAHALKTVSPGIADSLLRSVPFKQGSLLQQTLSEKPAPRRRAKRVRSSAPTQER